MVEPINVIILVVAGLCPLSFLVGVGCMFIIALQLGWGQYSESKTIEDVSTRQFSQMIDPYLSGGWDIAAVTQAEGQVGKLAVTIKRRRRRLL